MSNTFIRNALAVALASAFTLPALAAGNIDKPGAAELYLHAQELGIGTSPNPTAILGGVIGYNITAPDILIGRTNGSGDITVTLTFAGAELAAPLVAGNITVAGGQGTLNAGSVSCSSSACQFTITPPALGMVSGGLFTVAASTLSFNKAAGLAEGGSGITVATQIQDTNTATILASLAATQILSPVAGTDSVASSGTSRTIDVLSPSFKRQFQGTGLHAELGTVQVRQRDVSVAAGSQPASALGTHVAGNVAGGAFVYDANANIKTTTDDTVNFSLNVPQNAGLSFYATVAGACGGYNAANDVPLTGGPSIYTGTAGVDAAGGTTFRICAEANGTTVLLPQTLDLTYQINLRSSQAADPAPVTVSNFAKFIYNGVVVNVYSFNPSNNAQTDSLLRIVNTSSTSGNFTIEGFCPDGVTTLTPSTINIAAGAAEQLSSSVLSAGSGGLSAAMGDCPTTGRIWLRVTGEVGSAQVMNAFRSRVDGFNVLSGQNNKTD